MIMISPQKSFYAVNYDNADFIIEDIKCIADKNK
jgi:hypothetical protein